MEKEKVEDFWNRTTSRGGQRRQLARKSGDGAAAALPCRGILRPQLLATRSTFTVILPLLLPLLLLTPFALVAEDHQEIREPASRSGARQATDNGASGWMLTTFGGDDGSGGTNEDNIIISGNGIGNNNNSTSGDITAELVSTSESSGEADSTGVEGELDDGADNNQQTVRSSPNSKLANSNKQVRECEARYASNSNTNTNSNNNSGNGSNETSGGQSGGVDSGGSASAANSTAEVALLETIFEYFIYSIFTILFLIGTSTNTLILYQVGRKRQLAPMDIYIIMLAINDLIYILFALPVPPLYVLYYGEWVFGKFGCKMVAFFTSFSVHNSSMTVVNIAHLRFRMVVHPFQPKVSTLKASIRALIACLLAGIFTIPYVLVIDIDDDELCGRTCDEYWGPGELGRWKRFLFSSFTTIVQFLLPLIGFEYYYKPIRDKLILLEKTHSHAIVTMRHGDTSAAVAASGGVGRCRRSGQLTVSSPPPSRPLRQQQQRQHQELELSEIKSSSQVETPTFSSTSATATATAAALALNQSAPPPPTRTAVAAAAQVQQRPNNLLPGSAATNNHQQKKTDNNNNNSSSNSSSMPAASPTTLQAQARAQVQAAVVAAGISSSERERIRQMNLLSRLKQTRKVVYFFSFTWLPLNVFNLVYIWAEPTTYAVYTHLVVQAAACCGVCLNPVIYPLSNDNYRQESQHMLPVWLLRKLDSLLKA